MALQILLWVVAVQTCALAALPLALRLWRHLPDCGYAFAKAFGLLLVGYLVWLLAMLQFLDYRPASIVLVLVALGAVIWWSWGSEALSWLSTRRRLVLTE